MHIAISDTRMKTCKPSVWRSLSHTVTTDSLLGVNRSPKLLSHLLTQDVQHKPKITVNSQEWSMNVPYFSLQSQIYCLLPWLVV